MNDLPALTTETLWAILRDELPDATVNQLIWQALGYHWDGVHWDCSQVPTVWRTGYPEPPDFIASRPATIHLTRSIPATDKQLLKEQLGFEGYTIAELTPQRTRRATMVNWLLSYLKNSPSAQ